MRWRFCDGRLLVRILARIAFARIAVAFFARFGIGVAARIAAAGVAQARFRCNFQQFVLFGSFGILAGIATAFRAVALKLLLRIGALVAFAVLAGAFVLRRILARITLAILA